jgi:diguanylate cyclase (GGDEF)-like protein
MDHPWSTKLSWSGSRQSKLVNASQGNNADVGDRHVGPLGRVYTIAVVSVLILAVLGQILVHRANVDESETAKAVHLGATVRTEGLKLIGDFYALGSEQGAGKIQRENRIRNDLTNLRAAYSDLSKLGNTTASPAMGSGGSLPADYAAVTEAVDSALLQPEDAGAYVKAAAAVREHETTLEASLDGMVSKLAFQSEHRAHSVPAIQLSLLLCAVVILLLQVRYLLMPRLKYLKRQVEALTVEEQEAKAQKREFELENVQLRANQEALRDVATNLEAVNTRFEVAARRFEELFQGLPIACLGYDASGSVLEWNRASEMMFGDATRLFGKPLLEVLGVVEDSEELMTQARQVFSGASYQQISVEILAGETRRYLLCSMFPVHGTGDIVHGAIFACVDNTAQKQYEISMQEHLTQINDYSVEIEQQRWELKEANDRLQSLAMQDGLTGLFNHRAFQEALARDVRRCEREHGTLSLILLDIDHFKLYNDSFGHPAGDQLLKQFSQVLLQCSRESDLVARYGGEEFVTILSGTGVEGATLAAERIRSAVENAAWPHRKVTASLGVATFDSDGMSPADIIAAADKALYASKAAGRNRSTHWNYIPKAA